MTPAAAGLVIIAIITGLTACGSSSSTRERNAVVGEVATPCTLGGRGPTGGIVVALATSTSGTSVESAPAKWTTESQVNWKTISARVNEYRGGGFSDWKLPTIDQMDTLGNPILQFVGGNMIWSSTAISGSTYAWYWRGSRNVADQTSGPSAAGWVMQAVPVRNFTEANTPCTAVAAVTTTAAPATTTTTGVPATCANGGVCAKQQIGGGGGTIVSESVDAAGGATYLEVAPANWTANDMSLQMVDNYSISVAQKVKTYTIGGKNDWHLPTINEFASWCASGLVAIDKIATYWVQNEGGATLAGNATSCSSSYGQTNSNTMLRVRPVRVTGVSAQVRASAVAYFAANPTTTLAAPTTTSTLTTSTPTTIASTTTTRAASKCASGGTCVVGDTGPGGGKVFYVSTGVINSESNISNGGKYLEAAPNTWNGGTSDPAMPWCDKTTTMIGNPTTLGQGASNTKKMTATCSSTSAAKVVADLYLNKWNDWFLPSAEELSLMWRSRDVIGGFNNSVAYWSSSEAPGNVAKGVQRLVFNPVKWLEDTKAGNSLVRPIRAFSEGAIAPAAPVTTLPAVTTTSTIPLAPACASLSSCKVGERGPGESIIISAIFEGPTSRYVAIARDGWNGTAVDPKMTFDEAKTAVAAYRPNEQTGWTLPSYLDKVGSMGQILQLCRYAHNSMSATSNTCDETKPLRANWSVAGDDMSYWTSHPTAPSGATGYGTIMRVRDSSVWASTLRARNYVRPVLEFSYTAPPIPTTTTTLPQKCAQGGICKIGDVSPTGGLIVKFFGSGSSITYTEIAPRNWDASIAGLNNSNGDEPLAKYATASGVAQQFRGGGKTDWHLPDIAEMRDAFAATQAPTFSAATEKNGQRSCKVTSSAGMTNADQWGFYANYWISGRSPLIFSYPTGGVYPVVDNFDVSASEWQHYVRPVRKGTYSGPAMTYKNPTYSPAECETVAMATTTTTPTTRTCAQGGPCRIGDEGQRGGIVISVDNSKPRGQRNVEMAKFGWKFGRDDCAGSSFGFPCGTGEWDPITAGSIGDGYRLPSVAELQAVSKLPGATRDKLKLIDHYYWTSESSGKNMNVKLALDSGIGVDDKNKLRREPNATTSYSLVDAHWAVKISTGFTVSETYAYMRPVRAF
jgi:hypothetical protein